MKNGRLKLSRYNVYLSHGGGRAYIYNTLSRASVILEPEEWRVVKDLHRGIPTERPADDLDYISSLLSMRILCEPEVDEFRLFEVQHYMARYGDRQLTLTVAPTMNCNLACDYCFQKREQTRSVMSDDVIERAVAWVRGGSKSLAALNVAWCGQDPGSR